VSCPHVDYERGRVFSEVDKIVGKRLRSCEKAVEWLAIPAANFEQLADFP